VNSTHRNPGIAANDDAHLHDFDDIWSANKGFATAFNDPDMDGYAHRSLAIVTCFDSRIDPLRIVGMAAGDAKIVRNAGARVTDDVLRTLVLAVGLLGVTRVLVMPHTDCRMAADDEATIHAKILAASGVDTRSLEFRTTEDQGQALRQDLQRIRSYPLLPRDIAVTGAVYDVRTGALTPVAE
jgi:carbonic anhydrase